VFVRERVPGSAPLLSEIRPQLEREVLAERRKMELDALYERLLQRYTVTIEKPQPAPSQAASVGAGRSR